MKNYKKKQASSNNFIFFHPAKGRVKNKNIQQKNVFILKSADHLIKNSKTKKQKRKEKNLNKKKLSFYVA